MDFSDFDEMAKDIRRRLKKKDKKYLLLYGYNSVGKTRLSTAFRDIGWQGGGPDTLYYNAYTEDLFTWDNNLEQENESVLRMNTDSNFFDGLKGLEMESKIRDELGFYADFNFRIDYDSGTISFSREVGTERVDNVKISRGEENTFVWCFFLAIIKVAMDDGIEDYNWVKYLYIDDPVSSLDEHNAIGVANRLAGVLKDKRANRKIKTVISSHHSLFFNVMCNELKRDASKLFLSKEGNPPVYNLHCTGGTPFFHHVAVLKELCQAADSNSLYTHHFSMLRSILEKSASFHGLDQFTDCIDQQGDKSKERLRGRLINALSHGDHSLYEPTVMPDRYRDEFREVLNQFLRNYHFNLGPIQEVDEES